MSDFWLLLKTSTLQTFGLNRLFKHSHTRTMMIVMSLVGVLIVLGIMTFIGFYFFLFGSILTDAGAGELILLIGISVGSFLVMVGTLTKANGYLFRSKDFDLLMSMPIKPQIVVASKISALVVLNYASFLTMYVPCLVVYALLNTTTFMFWVYALIIFFIVPLLPIAVFSFLSFVLGYVTARMKYKNIISIVFMLTIFIGIMVISMRSGQMEDNPELFAESIEKVMVGLYPPSIFAFNGVQGNLVQLLIYIGISIVPFALFIMIIGKNFVVFNSKLGNKVQNKAFERHYIDDQRVASEVGTLLKKEFRRYFSLPMYVLNTVVGALLIPIMMVFLHFQMGAAPEEFAEFGEFMGLAMIGMAVFMVGITATTSASISLEGKQFWILKSAPVHIKSVFLAKLGLHIIVSIPFILIGAFIGLFLLKFTLVNFLFFIIIPTLVTIATAVAGLYFNLLTPRFDWDAEIKVIKQGMSVFLTLIYSFVASVVLILPTILILVATNNVLLTLIVATFIALTICVLGSVLLFTHGKKLYNRLKA